MLLYSLPKDTKSKYVAFRLLTELGDLVATYDELAELNELKWAVYELWIIFLIHLQNKYKLKQIKIELKGKIWKVLKCQKVKNISGKVKKVVDTTGLMC